MSKTRGIYEELKKRFGEENILAVDTSNWKNEKASLIKNCIRVGNTCSTVIIMPNKNGIKIILPLMAELKKLRKYQLIYPVYAAKHGEPSRFETADPQTLYRAMDLVNEPMPPGKYYVQYLVYDMFMRPMPLQLIEINWDGENVTLPEDFSWEGEAELKIPDAYWQ